MPQEWTKPSRETTKREDDPSAFLSFALCFLPYALFFALCFLPFALFFALFFTLSSRTASCADALRDLLFACWFIRLFLYVVIPSEALFADKGPAVRLLVPSPFSLRCHPERGAFCRRGTCCSLLPLPDIIATVESSDHTAGPLEVSCPRVCFSQPFPLRSVAKSLPSQIATIYLDSRRRPRLIVVLSNSNEI
jgi:hypothetical protein